MKKTILLISAAFCLFLSMYSAHADCENLTSNTPITFDGIVNNNVLVRKSPCVEKQNIDFTAIVGQQFEII